MRRREFLIVSSLGVTLSTLARAAGISAPDASLSAIRAVVYAPNSTVASEFARQHVAQGIPAFRADECMVRLWRGPLVQLIVGGPLRVAGTTCYSDFLIARDCARDLGLRVLREEWLKEGPVALVDWLVGSA